MLIRWNVNLSFQKADIKSEREAVLYKEKSKITDHGDHGIDKIKKRESLSEWGCVKKLVVYYMKKILFTIAFLNGYHGSVIHVYEWSKYFVSIGYGVTVICINSFKSIRKLYEESGIQVCDITEISSKKSYDIVFAYHFPVITYLLSFNLIECRKLILGSLSPFEPLESLPIFWEHSSLITVVSQEVLQKIQKNLKVPDKQIRVVQNSVPDDFIFFSKRSNVNKCLNIGVVSNHVPIELRRIQEYLPSTARVTYLGSNEKVYLLVDPQTLIKFDVVISIGKTVNYALCMGIPVFEYDYFGRCGYFSRRNFDLELMSNFSGRSSCRHCTPAELAKEIITGYEQALAEAKGLKEKAIDLFLLSKQCDNLLHLIESYPDFSPPDFSSGLYYLEKQHSYSFIKVASHLSRNQEYIALLKKILIKTSLFRFVIYQYCPK